jgi:hypothetical protein
MMNVALWPRGRLPGRALLFPGIAVGVVAVALPKAEAIMIEQHEAATHFTLFQA